jgi:hypothetical protein
MTDAETSQKQEALRLLFVEECTSGEGSDVHVWDDEADVCLCGAMTWAVDEE